MTFVAALALTLSGMLVVAVSAITLKILLPRLVDSFVGRSLESIFGHIGIVGIGLAVPLARMRIWTVTSGLLFAWLVVAILLGFSLHHFLEHADASSIPPIVCSCFALIFLTMCAPLFATWLASLTQSVFTLFAFFALGIIVGTIGYPVAVEPFLALREQALWGSILLGVTALLFSVVHYGLMVRPMNAVLSSALPWSYRLKWMLLGGLPFCAILGVATYINTELSPIPLLWIIPVVFGQIAWVVAFSRTSTREVTGWIVQVLAVLAIIVPLVTVLYVDVSQRDPGLVFAFSASVVVLLCAVLIPHRFTMLVQSILLVIVLVQMFASVAVPGSDFRLILLVTIHLLACVVTCRGCYGDAVKLAAADRLPEFLLCVQMGALICGYAYQALPPLLVPDSWGMIEYPGLLVACLVIRMRWIR